MVVLNLVQDKLMVSEKNIEVEFCYKDDADLERFKIEKKEATREEIEDLPEH